MLVLGVDPGSRVTGYGLVEQVGDRLRCVDFGSIHAGSGRKTLPFYQRLEKIHSDLTRLIERYAPGILAVEDLFYSSNVKSALKLGHTRGVILLLAAQSRIELEEYTPLEVKKSVVGYGRASKDQVQMMVRTVLNLDRDPQPHDAADALAVALCCLFRNRWQRIAKRAAKAGV